MGVSIKSEKSVSNFFRPKNQAPIWSKKGFVCSLLYLRVEMFGVALEWAVHPLTPRQSCPVRLSVGPVEPG